MDFLFLYGMPPRRFVGTVSRNIFLHFSVAHLSIIIQFRSNGMILSIRWDPRVPDLNIN